MKDADLPTATYRTLYCILRVNEDLSVDTFCRQILIPVANRLAARDDVAQVHYAMPDDISAAAISHRRESVADSLPDAVLVIRLNDDADAQALAQNLDMGSASLAVCLCREREVMCPSLGVDRRTEGSMQFCSLSRPAGLSHEEFMRVWWQEHTAIAIRTQSTFGYRQYEVIDRLIGDFYADAIVEEHFPENALQDPMVYFAADGDPARFKQHLDEMMRSCDRFIDPASINVVHLGEYHITQE